MFGLIRFSTIAHALIQKIKHRANHMAEYGPEERKLQDALLYNEVDTLAAITPEDKREWLLKQFEELFEDPETLGPEGVIQMNYVIQHLHTKFGIPRGVRSV